MRRMCIQWFPFLMADGGAGVASSPSDINSTAARPEPVTEWPEGELPAQMGGSFGATLLPGIYTLLLPETLAQLWTKFTAKDERRFLQNGQPNPTCDEMVERRKLGLDRNAPLVVQGGPHDGEPLTATITTKPRPRGKKDDPKTAWISDAAYMLDISLGDKSRPATADALVATINKYAGKTIRVETGLTAQCRPDKVRYIRVTVDGETQDMLDPSGAKGCGARYYTKDFKNPDAGKLDEQGQVIPAYDTEIACDCGTPTPEQAAAGAMPVQVVLRAFPQIERFLPPLGQGATK